MCVRVSLSARCLECVLAQSSNPYDGKHCTSPAVSRCWHWLGTCGTLSSAAVGCWPPASSFQYGGFLWTLELLARDAEWTGMLTVLLV